MHGTFVVSTALTLGFALCACQSTGVDQSNATASALKTISSELGKVPGDIDSAIGCLTALEDQQGDMRAEYASYSSAVTTLDSRAAHIRSLREDITRRKAEFMNSWVESSKKIEDADLRQRAEERRGKATELFDGLSKHADEIRAKFDPWMKELRDIRASLEHDLTADGVKTLSDVFGRVKKSGESLKGDIKSLIDNTEKVVAGVGTPPPPPAAKTAEK